MKSKERIDGLEIIAHRGCASLAPENTLLAARIALEIGADLWETDVSVTKDDRLILMHDDTLVRTTNVCECYPDRHPWRVEDFTLAEALELDAGSWFIEADPFHQIAAGVISGEQAWQCQGLRIPTLEQALAFTKSSNWAINVELKALPPEKTDFPLSAQLIAIIRETGLARERIRISSFDHELLLKVRELDGELELQALVEPENYAAVDWRRPDFKTYNSDERLVDERFMQLAKSLGIRINVYTVNDPGRLARCKALGVSGAFTDFPQQMVTR